MSDLRGDLGFMPCVELFRLLEARAFSGSIVVRRGANEKRLVVEDGKVVQAASTDPREFVGQILIYGGHLNEEEFEEAFQAQAATSLPLGKILVEQKKVPAAVVRSALEFKIRETAIELCSWTEGEFSVVRKAPDAAAKGIPVAPISLGELADAAADRAAAWGRIRKVFPSGGIRLGFGAGRKAPHAEPGTVEARIFTLLAEPRSIDELLLFLHATKFHLYAKLHSLVGDGVIRIVPQAQPKGAEQQKARGPIAASAPAPQRPKAAAAEEVRAAPPPLPRAEERPQLDADELLRRSAAALAKDAPELAVELARKALQLDASQRAVAALKEAEGALLLHLRKELVGRDLKPEVVVDRGRIRELPLTPPARYLLTRMNGSREVGAIVRVAPMRELDALEVIRRLLRDGLIRV